MSKYSDLCEATTAFVIKSIEEGASADDWRMPWHRQASDGSLLAPINGTTKNFYRGGNVWALAMAAANLEAEQHVWATYKQWQGVDAQVRKGERGQQLVKWLVKEDSKTGKRILIPTTFVVFNVKQVDNAPEIEVDDVDAWNGLDPLEVAEAAIAGTGASISYDGAGRAFYRPRTDSIHLPARETFVDRSAFYATTFHELGHWTGHDSRLKRDNLGQRFGSAPYAAEELVAELTAATLCAMWGVDNEPRIDHAQYVASWLKVLKDDPKAIMSASSLASKAVAFISEPPEVEAAAAA